MTEVASGSGFSSKIRIIPTKLGWLDYGWTLCSKNRPNEEFKIKIDFLVLNLHSANSPGGEKKEGEEGGNWKAIHVMD